MMEQRDDSRGSRRGLSVAPSPFNRVKFELGVVVLLLPLLWLVVGRLLEGWLEQLLALLAAGGAAALWLVLRTRSILRRLELEHGRAESDARRE